MINRTNQTVILEDGREYGIMKHILYQGRTFFVASEYIKEKDEYKKEFIILEQLIYDDKDCIVEVEDSQIIKTIIENIKVPE